MTTKELIEKMELAIRNCQYTIESCRNAVAILKAGKSDFTPQLILQRAADKEQEWMDRYKAELEIQLAIYRKEQSEIPFGACEVYPAYDIKSKFCYRCPMKSDCERKSLEKKDSVARNNS